MKTFVNKTKRKSKIIRSAHLSRFGYRGLKVKDQQSKIHTILHASGVQAKLTIGQSNNKYEQEADSVADNVMRMPEPKLQRQPEAEEEEEVIQTKSLSNQITPVVQRQEQPSDEEDEELQTKSQDGMLQRQAEVEDEETIQTRSSSNHTATVGETTNSRIQSLKGGGQPLPANQRNFYESRMGYNFGGVRIHTDSNAADTAQSVQAKAFTVGNNIVFNSGQYVPNNDESKRLLAHELTHVIQQGQSGINNARVQRKPDKKIIEKKPAKKSNFTVDLSTPISNPKFKFNKTADQLNAWEKAVFNSKIKFEFSTNSVAMKSGETGSSVSSLSFSFENPQFQLFIARHLVENAKDRTKAIGERITWKKILSRVRKHALVHLYLYRASSMKMEKEIAAIFDGLPTKDKPWNVDKVDLDEYIKLLGIHWAARVKIDLIKTTCNWEKQDYPTLLKGIHSVFGSFKVSCEPLPKLPATPLRPIKIKVRK